MSQALQRMSARPSSVAPGYLWPRQTRNVCLLGLGESRGGRDRVCLLRPPQACRSPVGGRLGPERDPRVLITQRRERVSDPGCPFSGLDLRDQFPGDPCISSKMKSAVFLSPPPTRGDGDLPQGGGPRACSAEGKLRAAGTNIEHVRDKSNGG